MRLLSTLAVFFMLAPVLAVTARQSNGCSKPIQTAILERRPILRSMLDPKKIALIGATEAPNSVGRTLMENLVSSGRIVYPINPKRTSVLGVKAFPKIEDAPATVDLAIIATPAATVPEVVGECASAGLTS